MGFLIMLLHLRCQSHRLPAGETDEASLVPKEAWLLTTPDLSFNLRIDCRPQGPFGRLTLRRDQAEVEGFLPNLAVVKRLALVETLQNLFCGVSEGEWCFGSSRALGGADGAVVRFWMGSRAVRPDKGGAGFRGFSGWLQKSVHYDPGGDLQRMERLTGLG